VSDTNPWLSRHLKAIERLEQERARAQRDRAGVGKPVQLNFARNLPPELDQAAQRLWDAGCSASTGTGHTDPVLRQLYIMVNRGTSCLSESEFLEFTTLPPEAMRQIGRWLTEGHSYEEAAWLARNQQKDPNE
jgi:hypothetical protein